MKRLISVVIAALFLILPPAYASDSINVITENEAVEFDVPPQIIDGRTMVPVRKIFEALDADVEWFASSQLILATRNADIVAMVIGDREITVTNALSGKVKTIELDVPPQITDGRTMVPLRAVSEALGMDVRWDGETQTITISRKVI